MKRILGYIKLTEDSGKILWVNCRAILRYERYRNMYAEHTHTRLWYLDGRDILIRESEDEIHKKIAKL
jgi:uncharacterized protein YlzI (FlbEa/FlbD family)